MAMVNISAPWVVYYREVQALFFNDSSVNVMFDEEQCKLSLYVDDVEKASAIAELLPVKKEFGNVTLEIDVIPANGAALQCLSEAGISIGHIFKIAFLNNDALGFVKTIEGIGGKPVTYVVFAKRVVQYYTDSLSDIYGNTSTLYQTIAADVFKNFEVYYNTNIE